MFRVQIIIKAFRSLLLITALPQAAASGKGFKQKNRSDFSFLGQESPASSIRKRGLDE